jgi:Na+/alanine symporter
MRTLKDILGTIDSYIGSANWFVYFLSETGIFFTFLSKFHAVRIVRGQYGTEFTGNIAGVALSIRPGDHPALFWMLRAGSQGMATKFVAVTLLDQYVRKIRRASSNEKSTNYECDLNILI